MNLFSQYAQYTANPQQALEVLENFPEASWTAMQNWPPEQLQALLKVLGNSNFLARWAKRSPEKILELQEQKFSGLFSETRIAPRLKLLSKLPKEKFIEALIDFKYQCLFGIALEDLGGLCPFESVVENLSRLAQIILEQVLIRQEEELAQSHGLPLQQGNRSQKIPFSVIAMGKLGGRELNFSSDVDLIYFYGSDEGEVLLRDQKSHLSLHEYFIKLSEGLSRDLSQKTQQGFLYRVDLELRPEGKSGPLANSIDAMLDYYENFGADWEKQAMIKASCVAGSKNLFEAFFSQIHPFVYPKTTDFSFLKNLKSMKEKILFSIAKLSNRGYHVKLGEGGIREIEFFVQAFQFLLGGKISSLQTTSTLKALARLQEAQIIDAKEQHALREAYIFLRTLEHRLQLVEEQQTHQLPSSDEELEQLARRMGYKTPDPKEAAQEMLEDLQGHRQYVTTRFEELLSRGSSQ